MKDSNSAEDQNHPLYSNDREIINGLLAKDCPKDSDLVELARLILRYEGFPGAKDLQEDLMKTLRLWGLTNAELNSRTKKIWKDGFRPGQDSRDAVGSGFDTSDDPGS